MGGQTLEGENIIPHHYLVMGYEKKQTQKTLLKGNLYISRGWSFLQFFVLSSEKRSILNKNNLLPSRKGIYTKR